MHGDEFLTISQFATKVAYSERRIRQKCRNGQIQAIKIGDGRKWLIPVGELAKVKKDVEEVSHVKNRHFDELAEVARTVYEVQQFILSYEESQSFSVTESPAIPGFFSFSPSPKRRPALGEFAGNSVGVDYPQIEYFFRHLLQEFPELGLKDWREVFATKLSQKVIDELRYWSNTAKFKYCDTCQVCSDLRK